MFPTVAVVAVPNFPKEFHYFALPSSKRRSLRARSTVVVIICCLQKDGRFAALVVVVVPNGCPIPEGGRFAALVEVPHCPKETNYFTFKKAAASRP